MSEEVTGVVDQITYYNEDSGWSVVKIVPDQAYPAAMGRDGTVTVVGSMPAFKEGETAHFTGEWDNHKSFGMQFKVQSAAFPMPRTEAEIINYLSSEKVKGIGPDTAREIVDRFGEATIEILDEDPNRVAEVPGLRPAVLERFVKDWTENHVQRHTLVFLQDKLGFNGRVARRIYSKYGAETRRQISTDPYQLAADELLSFEKSDAIAKRLGMLDGHPGRLRAGLLEAVNDFAHKGHTFAPREGALARAAKLLRMEDEGTLEEALNYLQEDERLGEELIEKGTNRKPIRAIFLPRYWHAENSVAERLRAIATRSSQLIHQERNTDWQGVLSDISQSKDISPSPEQLRAVQAALTNKISVLTGGPGTGKTTALRMLVDTLRESGFAFQLAAPTGRAARRLSAATEHIASTIHRMLKWDPDTGGFTLHEGNPLRTDLVVIDEASMLDLLLFKDLLKALQPTTHLLLVGDVDQLPSVGAGNVLSDVIESEIAKVTRLKQVFRQDDSSHIISNAHRINQGQDPVTDNQSSDFFFFNLRDSKKLADMLVDIVKHRIPYRWGCDPARDIQVIAPMKPGLIGVNNLNRLLQQHLNGSSLKEVRLRNRVLRVGDKVMQKRNDYDKEVFNGDIGFIESIDLEDKSLKIRFDYGDPDKGSDQATDDSYKSDLEKFLELPPDSDLVTYDFSETDDLMLAYCITVHKSQGSEFPVVVMPIHPSQKRMLQRNLLYTAITRAKQLVVLVGTREAVQQAVYNDNVDERHSGLLQRLRG